MGQLRKMKKVVAWFIVGVVGVFACGLIFLIVSPHYSANIVRSESMVPVLQMGDVVVMGPVSGIEQIKPGMIISFMHDEQLIAHEVVSVQGDAIQTKGRALEDVDPWLVSISEVQGAYLFRVPYLGYLSKFVRTPLGWGLLVILPAALLIGYLVWDLVLRTPKERGAPTGRKAPPKRRAASSTKSAARKGRRHGLLEARQ